MRRFRKPHEAVHDDWSTAIHWRGVQASPVYHISYLENGIVSLPTISYRMDIVEGITVADTSGFLPADSIYKPWSAKNGWLSAASASGGISAALRTSWSLSFWTNGNFGVANATVCFLEYAKGSSLDNNSLNLLGVYASSQGLSLRWDISTTTQQIIDTNVPANGSIQVAHEVTRGATRGTLKVYRNGELRHTTASTWFPSQTSLTSNWTMAGSGRYGNATGTAPAFVPSGGGPGIEDVVFWTRAISPGKARSIYGDGRRPWDEAALVKSGNYKILHRVLVYSANEWVDMSDFRNRNWCIEATVSDSVEDQRKKASIVLHRRLGRHLDLARLNTEAALTYGRASEPMIELRSKIKVEYALVPVDWSLQGWEWVECFDGLVEGLDWGSAQLQIDASDYGLALEDVYRPDARRYEYGSVGTPSWAHIQVLIDENTPSVRGLYGTGSGWTPGYAGLVPELFTPVDPYWQIRYDHSPADTVDRLIANISEQIGWDCRYRYYDSLQQDRLTFSEPPRTNSIPIEVMKEGADGFTKIRFGEMPHGLQVGQTATIAYSNVSAYNGGCTVTEILDWHTIKTDREATGSPSTATTGAFVYAAAYQVPLNSIRDVSQISLNGDSIRNYVEIRYNRRNIAATLPFMYVESYGGGSMWVHTLPEIDLSKLEEGNDLTVYSSTTPELNATYTVASKPTSSNVVEILPETVNFGDIYAATGSFYSSYLQYAKRISLNTASIRKFGLRKAGVFEGSIEGIDSLEEAAKLADGILSDLAYPTVDLSAEIKCAPWLDIYDLLSLERDPLGRWGTGTEESPTPLTTAVVSYSHTFGEKASTTLELRHDHPTKGLAWLKNYGMLGKGPHYGVPLNNPLEPGALAMDLNTSLAQSFGFSIKQKMGKAAFMIEETEVHAHTTASYGDMGAEGQDDGGGTYQVKGNSGIFAGAFGKTLTPGQTYYTRFRTKDKFGNYSPFSTTTQSFVPRFTTKPASAWATYNSTVSVRFRAGGWSAYPLNNDSLQVGYDNWDNMSVWAGGSTAQWVHESSTAFIMPCDGECAVEGWLGLKMSAAGKSTKATSVGIFRLNSTLPNSGSSVPCLYPRLSPNTNSLVPTIGGEIGTNHGFLMGFDAKTVSFYASMATTITLMTSLWVAFSEKISANSGDRIVVGIHGGTGNDFGVHHNSGVFSSCTSWVKFTVISQN